MSIKEATARIKINKLLEAAGWRFFADGKSPANIQLEPKPGTDVSYLELAMRTKTQYLNDIAPQAAQKNINIEILRTIAIPLPPLATQQKIVAEIEAEHALVAANRELITRFEKKIQATLARVWGEETPPG